MNSPIEWLATRPFAHRGLHDITAGAPENSMDAFEATIKANYPIELDVQTSRDGRAMVFHDLVLTRMTGADGFLRETDAAKLDGLRLRESQQTIPTLAAVLDLINGQVPVIVEIKSLAGPIGHLETAVRPILGSYPGIFAVTSFEARSLTWFKEREPNWPRGQNVGVRRLADFKPWWRRLAWRYLYDVDGARPDFVVYDRRDLPNWAAKRVRAAGKPLLTFTIKDRTEMNRLAPHVDNIIFEGFRP